MPFATSGAGSVTGANIVDESIGPDDLGADALSEYLKDALSVCPFPAWLHGAGTNGLKILTIGTNTTLHLSKVVIPHRIKANKVSFRSSTANTAGVIKVVLFAEDGQTQIFAISTASISGSGIITTSLASETTIPAGTYYLGILPVGTASIDVPFFADVNGSTGELNELVVGEAILNGTLTVTAGTIPATIDPTAITGGGTTSSCAIVRLDN